MRHDQVKEPGLAADRTIAIEQFQRRFDGDGKRKRRIAAGCGRPVHEINQLLKQFMETKKMMGQMNDPRFMAKMQRMAKMGGGANLPF